MGEPFATLSLEHLSTVDRVAGELRRAVFDGELESGTALREVALAETLGVSRQTVREALTLLVAEGLAVREPHRGVAVSSPDPESVRDVCRARAVLEGAGVRRWPVAGEERRAHVRACLDAYISAVHAGAAYEQLNERHLAFHVSLVALTGSPRLVRMAGQLVVEVKLALAQVDPARRNAHDHADSHLQLLRLLENGDHDGASHHLARHLAEAEADLLDALDLG